MRRLIIGGLIAIGLAGVFAPAANADGYCTTSRMSG